MALTALNNDIAGVKDDTSMHRKRMRHFEGPGTAHFSTFSCYRRMPLLNKDRTRVWFVEALDRARLQHGFLLCGWVMMPEHVHLLIRPMGEGYRIASILQSIKQPVARRAMDWLKENDPSFLERLTTRSGKRQFWQAGGGYDRNITTPEDAVSVLDYIHLNPVRRQLVEKITDWKWSSAVAWETGEDEPIEIDRSLREAL